MDQMVINVSSLFKNNSPKNGGIRSNEEDKETDNLYSKLSIPYSLYTNISSLNNNMSENEDENENEDKGETDDNAVIEDDLYNKLMMLMNERNDVNNISKDNASVEIPSENTIQMIVAEIESKPLKNNNKLNLKKSKKHFRFFPTKHTYKHQPYKLKNTKQRNSLKSVPLTSHLNKTHGKKKRR